jgi:hypothetical protein
LRTTTRSSEALAGRRAGATVGATALVLLAGCVTHTPPEEFFRLTPESPAHKAAQTRYFETSGEAELLSASAAVLQDLGFQVSECVREVGFLRAAKERSAREYGQEISRILVGLLSASGLALGANTLILRPVDLQQQINATLVTRPLDAEGSRHEVRILFYRLVWKGSGQSGDLYVPPGEQKMEMIRDPEIYQQFFASLAKAIFLEAHKI